MYAHHAAEVRKNRLDPNLRMIIKKNKSKVEYTYQVHWITLSGLAWIALAGLKIKTPNCLMQRIFRQSLMITAMICLIWTMLRSISIAMAE